MKKLFILSFLLLSFFSRASHISGGQITYKCLGNNVYEVKLTYFWDCEGGFNPGTSQTINVNGCGNALTVVVNQSTLTPGDGVPADGLCPNSGLTTCKNRIEYIGNITLPSACNNWIFSLGSCCRGGNITNISGGTSASYYHFATLDNTITSCNNSPDISIGLLPNFCVNQAACFNLGATEIDGHTLSYAFVSAYQTATTFVNYNATYTGTAPIVGITIDPNTGQINLTPTTIGDFVITVQITEKDANGNIIGTIMRDFQVIVTNCTNQTVTCGQGAITNVTSGTAPSGNILQICENIPFCFDVSFTDPNVNDSLRISSPNIATSLPGSTMVMSYTPGVKNKIKATICWTPPAGSSGLNTSFVLIVKDNACPVPGTQVLNYFIDVLPATSAGPDQTICGTQAASINAVGSSTVFAWTDLAGTPITVGPAFSCNPCNNPVIKPAVTSTYVVTNVGGGTNCKNKDTLVIFVVPDFTLTAGSSVANSCLNSAVQFTSSINPAGPGYSYTWSPSAPLTSTNTANTSATFSVPGTYNYTVTAISSTGCFKQSNSVPFVAQPVTMPIFTVVPTNTTVCLNTAVPLSINFGTAPPTSCGLATTGCATTNTFQVGTSVTNGSSSNYNPYGGLYESVKTQFLYTAAELNAAGIVAGKLNKIAFNVTNFNGNATSFSNFTIKLKCVSYSTLTTGMDNAGLVQVFNPTTINATLGWNNYNFTQAYEWDGTSNLLVDVCFFNTSWDGNLSIEYSTLGFNSSRYVNADNVDQCPLSTTDGTSTIRPNARFGNCSSVANPNSFSFSWLPVTGLSNPNISNPTATLSSSIVYSVVVTPTAATTCSNVGTTSLTVINPTTPTITAVSTLCSNAASFTLSALPAGGTWSLTTATSTLGVFTPSIAAIGNNTITYTYGGTGCAQTTTAIVTVERFVPSTITGTINPICIPSSTINLATALTTSTLGVGVWSGNGVTGTTFDPVAAGAGTHTLTYSTNSSPTASLCPSSSTIAVTLNSVPQPTIASAGPVCTNASTLALSGTPTGGTWLGSGVSSSGILTPSLATVGNNTYTYTVGSATCSVFNTSTISIEQYVPSTITGTINPICLPSPAINLATALTTSTLGTGVWSGNGVTGTTFDPAIAAAGTHTLMYSTNSSPTATLCPSSSTIEVNINSVAQPTITQAGPLCTNASTFALIGTPTGGIWLGAGVDPNGILTPSLAIIGNNTYSYTVGSATCSAVNTTTVSIEQYVPSTITGTINPLCISNPMINLSTALTTSTLGVGVWSGNGVSGTGFDPSVAGSGVHTLTYSTNSNPTATLCPSFSVITVAVNSVIQPTITPAGPFCDNYGAQQMVANPTGGVWSASAGSSVSASGLFSPSPILVGSNKLYYTLTNAPCVKKDSIIVDVIHFVPATIIGALGPYCIYEPSVNLQDIAQFTGGTWSGTGVSSGSFTPSAALAPTAVTPGTFVITYITNPSPLLNCGETRTTSIIVNPKPEANAFPDSPGGCNYSFPILFSTSTVNTGTATWDFGDGSPIGNGLMVTHTYTNPGTYIATITYTDNAGCMDTTQIPTAIIIFPVPDAAFAPSLDVTTVINAEIVFTNQTSDLPNNSYTWNFGGLGASTEVSPTYLFDNSGEYFITLIAVSPDGCQDTAVKKITINPDVVLYVPNAFTPGNNDGLNDVFQIFLPPTGVDYTTFSLSIYDRWGELIFKTNDVNESWTGAKNNSGPILKQEIFVWKIDFQDEKKKFYSKMGHVSLLHK